MNYRIEQKGAFEMFGVYGIVSQDLQTAFADVTRFHKQCDEDGSEDQMNELLGRFGHSLLHAALFDHTGESFKYLTANSNI